MSELNLSELKFTEIDIKNFVNSSLDVEEGSVLFVNHDDKDKLDKYVNESLKKNCLLYTSPSPRDLAVSRMPSSA